MKRRRRTFNPPTLEDGLDCLGNDPLMREAKSSCALDGETQTVEPQIKSQPLPPLADWRSPISIDELERFRARLFRESSDLLRRKGNDYNSTQQTAGDTLFNLRVCEILGVVPTPVDGLLVRMSDKFMRLISLTRPQARQQVNDESLEDTLKDFWNYGTYALAMLRRAKGQKIE